KFFSLNSHLVLFCITASALKNDSTHRVPGYSSLRKNLLHLAPRLANLPQEVKDALEDPNSR
ncbi:2OG-Fe(II) oxygenase family oxidoreductase, partial [Trifolium medium]|nr:2OG-Fe(II) oxygenase family oxidoreductase [Trifolium medium]